VLSLGSIVAAETVPVGGEIIDRAVIQHLRNQHELMLPNQAVQPLHLALSVAPSEQSEAEVYGRDVSTGLFRTVNVDTESVRAAIRPPLTAMVDAIRSVLRQCQPDLVADLADRGVMLVGGSALLPGLDTMLRQATGMPVHVAEQPAVCAVEGLGAMLEGRIRLLHRDPLSR
jgi:rod shape-determining protein MreB